MEAQTGLTNSDVTPVHIQGFVLAHPNIYFIYDLVDEVHKGTHPTGHGLRATAGYLSGRVQY